MYKIISVKDHTEKQIEMMVNTDHIAFIVEKYVHMSNGASFEVDHDTLKELMLELAPKAKRVKNNEPDSELLELFNELHRLVGGKGKATFSLVREKKLKDLLTKHRMTEKSLKIAAKNIGEDEFLQGKSSDNTTRYGDIDYLLRPDKASKWADYQKPQKKGMF